jgi:hypothetical protein
MGVHGVAGNGQEADVSLDRKAVAVKISQMTDSLRSTGSAYWLSVFIGAYVGITLQMVVTNWVEPVDPSELWAIPVLLLVYGILAVPFVAIGLALFGLPVTAMLRRKAKDWWMVAVAAIWGSLAGKFMYYAVDHLLFLGHYDILMVSFFDMGVIYGLPTGLAWWALYRRELSSR